jgi:probable rRNA maturation factor
MQVLISNRQRIIKLSPAQIEGMASKLCQAISENLLAEPIPQFTKAAFRRLDQKASLSLVFLSNQGIRKINKQWRSKDKETDVLSFALSLTEPPDDLPWELGEIFISVEKATAQAASLNHSLERELAFLFVHGFLHIFGFDHENPQDEALMFRRQKDILKRAGYPRL